MNMKKLAGLLKKMKMVRSTGSLLSSILRCFGQDVNLELNIIAILCVSGVKTLYTAWIRESSRKC
jgi:hypothetical protein